MVYFSACALFCLLGANGNVVLMEFTADWCGACRSVEPTVQRMVADGYPVQRIQVDHEQELASRFRVTSVPCFILVANGQEVDRVVGAASYARLVQMFERANASLGQPSGNNAERTEPTLVRGQNPAPSGFGLPRPLASIAKNLRGEPPANAGVPPAGMGAAQSTSAANQAPTPRYAPTPAPTAVPTAPSATPSFTENMQGLDPQRVQQALQATVRLRVESGASHSVGSGTIIDTHGAESLVVTCGHLFRDSGGKGRIQVDIFATNPPRTVDGTLISYDLDRDIALVAIAPGTTIAPVRVAPPAFQVTRGQPVFSIGCDKGANPSVRPSAITSIDRYVGAPNLEVAGMPVDGRSGGGLFSADGFLIGVCNAADPQDQEGIFASLPIIHWELDKIGQREIYDPRGAKGLVAAPQPDVRDSQVGGVIPRDMPQANLAIDPIRPTGNSSADTEVICIVRSRANPQGSEQLLILDRPSRELLDRLTTESRRTSAPEFAQSSAPRQETPVVPPNRFDPQNQMGDRSPVVRAQSNDR